MGWESRDWAKWSEEERQRHLGSAGSGATTGGSSHRLRIVVWSSLVIVILVLVGSAFLARQLVGAGSTTAAAPPEINVIYGWRHVPPHEFPDIPPSRVTDRIGDHDVICTNRVPAGKSRWVCDGYAVIQPGWRVIELPADYPDTIAPCSQKLGPGGRPIPCPAIEGTPA